MHVVLSVDECVRVVLSIHGCVSVDLVADAWAAHLHIWLGVASNINKAHPTRYLMIHYEHFVQESQKPTATSMPWAFASIQCLSGI